MGTFLLLRDGETGSKKDLPSHDEHDIFLTQVQQ